MHAYHNKDHMPWIDSEIITHLNIKHYFCDYIECANLCKILKNRKIFLLKVNYLKVMKFYL